MGGQDLFALKPVLLPGDAAAVRARRLLQGLIQKDSEF
jgi:vanillate O-demethylase monooxygenase subunit